MSDQDLYYETRFAVVMYGGISLAIYINGVAQELYRMVRATARKKGGGYLEPDESKLDGPERVYREIGEELRTKFVVDILSGTSAGGLNAIFLAKALANNQQFSKLAEVWKNVADVNTLIYDGESVKDLPVRLDVPDLPPYLMNSQRMAYLLYKAYEDMDEDSPAKAPSDFVNELDLYVTATDLYGRDIKLHTTNPHSFPKEKRFRKVFHLRYAKGGDEQNDFTQEDNPFLAFISRCTSAIPPAFESMTLNDMLNLPGVNASVKKRNDWKKYFEETKKDEHLDRPYADGGYLDNKPFSYATESLLNRTADHPVDRKLIYIEPSPQKLPAEGKPGARPKPNVIENVTKATVTLPMYEPIRDDLETVHRRNRMIERAQETLREVEKHLYEIPPESITSISRSEWPTLGLKDCIDRMGPSFGAYITLRVNTLLDKITADIADTHNIERQSQEFFELHKAVWSGFNQSYTSEPASESGKGKKTWNEFLQNADIDWRMRRLNYLHAKIDEMLVLGNTLQSPLDNLGFAEKKVFLNWEELKEQASTAKRISPADKKEPLREHLQTSAAESIRQSVQKRMNDLSLAEARGKPGTDDAAMLQWIREVFRVSEGGTAQIQESTVMSLITTSEFLPLFIEALREIKFRLNAAQKILSDSRAGTRKGAGKISSCKDQDQVTGYVEAFIEKSTEASQKSSIETKKVLGLLDWGGELPALQLAMLYLQAPYEAYEYYDRLTYPFLVANELGEADIVDIWRISPDDSKSFEGEKFEQKLGGQTLVNFGAFFKMEWRENDIMWGRLDGAEQIIRSLGLPPGKQEEYIRMAQAAILRNEVSHKNESLTQSLRRNTQFKNVRMNIMQAMPGIAIDKSKSRVKAAPQKIDDDLIDDSAVINQMGDSLVLGVFEKEFDLDLSLEPRNALQLAARSAQVAGKMFEGLSIAYSLKNNPLAGWLTRAGQFLFWAVEMATTDSLFSMIARNIFFLLYFTGLIFVAAGSLSPESKFPAWGWGMIGFTAFLQYARMVLKTILIERSLIDFKKIPAADKTDSKSARLWKALVPPALANPSLFPILGGLILLAVVYYADGLLNFLAYMKEIFFVIGAILIAFGAFVMLVYGIGNRLSNWMKKPVWTLLALASVTLIFVFAMGWSTAPLNAAGHTFIEFELANPAQKAVILEAWSGMERYVWWTLFLDFPFLLGATIIPWILWDLVGDGFQALDKGEKPAGFCRLIAGLTVLAGLADFLENIAFMGILYGYAGDFLAPMGFYSTHVKFGLFAVSLAFLPVMAIWLWIMKRRRR
ncbi:MAG: patatin-like protein [Chloroflexi bacterium]|nr:patatin-like protein [Chloroflexota bacterium]